MERWAGKTAIVTGAASGIGEAIATELIRHRVNVIAVDIAYERLQSTATKWGQLANRGEYHLKKCDISKKEDIDDLFTFVESLGGVNIMVNNAGLTNFSRVIDTNWETMEKLVKVFMLGTTAFMIRASHSMRKQNTEGHIINVNSVLGLMIPNYTLRKDNDAVSYNIYPACKHGTVAVTETVRRELAKIEAKIRVTSICPGLVHTNLSAFDTVVGGFLQECPALEPQDIASTVIYALSMRSEVELSEILVRHRGELE
ncbi:farnesol dehydrogenase [Lasioglossum baleicum]|uniref:farnesol dehydrogenase n=1 Tax=Lasioglossum baleicum TaxID=434251 RepID=UPI003FCE6E76